MELKDTIKLMESEDYKERFKAEYYQTKIRYEKLKKLNNQIEAHYYSRNEGILFVESPTYDCSKELLRKQQHVMGEYLHLLEVRAEMEKIEL